MGTTGHAVFVQTDFAREPLRHMQVLSPSPDRNHMPVKQLFGSAGRLPGLGAAGGAGRRGHSLFVQVASLLFPVNVQVQVLQPSAALNMAPGQQTSLFGSNCVIGHV